MTQAREAGDRVTLRGDEQEMMIENIRALRCGGRTNSNSGVDKIKNG